MIRYLVIHGGAGKVRNADAMRIGMAKALEAALQCSNALDAVEEAVKVLEDDPNFNAGTGSVLNRKGEVEMDAMIATGSGKIGGVAAIKYVKNPISVARKVMENTEHVLIVGEGATHYARKIGFPYHNPITKERLEKWKDLIQERKVEYFLETVGAVAYDGEDFVAATSTGGLWLKLPGRVGDTPLFGAGTYASRNGAASATGHGESIIANMVAYRAVENNLEAMQSAKMAIGNIRAGVILVKKDGIGYAYNTEMMPLAIYDGEKGRVIV